VTTLNILFFTVSGLNPIFVGGYLCSNSHLFSNFLCWLSWIISTWFKVYAKNEATPIRKGYIGLLENAIAKIFHGAS